MSSNPPLLYWDPEVGGSMVVEKGRQGRKVLDTIWICPKGYELDAWFPRWWCWGGILTQQQKTDSDTRHMEVVLKTHLLFQVEISSATMHFTGIPKCASFWATILSMKALFQTLHKRQIHVDMAGIELHQWYLLDRLIWENEGKSKGLKIFLS